MSSWISIPVFINTQVVRARQLQDLWRNLYSLKDRTFALSNLPGDGNDAWTYDVLAWANIDPVYYREKFESYGGDVLAIANIRFSHALSNGTGFFRFTMDGVAVGNTSGLHRVTDWRNVQEADTMMYLWEGLAAGEHEVVVQFQDGVAEGSAMEVWKQSCLGVYILEF